MFGDYSQELLRSGIIEIRAGNRAAGRRYLDRALYMANDREVTAEAWYWMSLAADGEEEKRAALENCLANDLQHARARRALAVLDGKLKVDEIIDPEAPMAGIDLGKMEARQYVCPRCGGRMMYAPDGQSLVCEYCKLPGRIVAAKARAGETDFIVAMATRRGHSRPLREQIRHCQDCGAEFILPAGQISFICAYCGCAQVVSVAASREVIEPDGILPHAFDQRHAQDVLDDWMAALKIAQKDAVQRPRGLYLPAWSFTLGGGIDYTGERAATETADRSAFAARREEVRDRHPVMLNLSVAASRRPSAPFARLMASYDMGAVQPYDARYLAAWPAELYDISMAEASLEARGRAYAELRHELPSLVAPVRVLSTSSANLTIDSFRLDLLPVWMTEVSFASRSGIVLINGQNETVQGDGLKPSGIHKGDLMSWLGDLLKD
jgi:predicted RNA-binding Zn-ribbon protein involved in translation (DUF1610 family)